LNGKAANGIIINRYNSKNLTGAVKRVENCVIHDINFNSMRYALLVGNGKSCITENVEFINNTIYNTPRSGLHCYEQYQGGTGYINNVVIRGNTVYNAGNNPTTAGSGIEIKNDCRNITIEFNYVHDNMQGVSVANDSSYPAPKNVMIENNIITHNDNNGLRIAKSGSKSVSIISNVIYNNTGPGINFASDLAGTIGARIHNNTLFHNTKGEISVSKSSAKFSTLEIKNNILIPSSGKPATCGSTEKITSQYNNLITNPGFKNTSNLPDGFIGTYGVDMRPNKDGLSLTSNSTGIGGGVDLGTSYNHAINSVTRTGSWDIGAYEFDSNNIMPIVPPKNLRTVTSN
jgi:hypothetical protein